MRTIAENLAHLERIAAKNKDKFRYEALIRPQPNGKVLYGFDCKEDAEGHIFACDVGTTLFDAINGACTIEELKQACDEWDWKYCD